MQGWLLTLTGEASDAVPAIKAGIAAMRSTGATAYAPWYLSCYGEGLCRNLDKPVTPRRCIEEALAAMKVTKRKMVQEIREIALTTGLPAK